MCVVVDDDHVDDDDDVDDERDDTECDMDVYCTGLIEDG